MSEKKYSDEQMKKIKELKQAWIKEVDKYFKERYEKKPSNTLDGGGDPELLRIQQKYTTKIKEIIGEVAVKENKSLQRKHKQFSDIVEILPEWLPKLPNS